MPRPLPAVLACAGLALAPALLSAGSAQDPAAAPAGWDFAALKTVVAGMGYELKELSETKFEATLKTEGFDVPLAFEISPSGRYVWLTAFLGKVPEGGLPAAQANALLRQNHAIQPAHFYVTSNSSLMLGLAAENRGLDAVMLRRAMDKIAGDVGGTFDDWSLAPSDPALEVPQ